MSGYQQTRQGLYPPIQSQPSRRCSSYGASASQPDDNYYEDISRYEENYQQDTYQEQLRRALRDLHEDCREVLWNRLGVNPDTHGNYLTIAENINEHGYDAFGLMITQEEAFYYHNSMEVQNIIRSMVQQYHDFPPDVVQEFNPLPRQPPVRPRPRTSVDST
jgi:hypothetical protein